MTFADFKAIVLENLGPDADRSGTGLSELRDRAIINAMVDLQRFVRVLRLFNTFTRQVTDLQPEGRTSTGVIPAGVIPKEWWIVSRGVGEGIIITNPARPTANENGVYKLVADNSWAKEDDPSFTISLDSGQYLLKQDSTILYSMDATTIESPLEGEWTAEAGDTPVPEMVSADSPSRYRLEWFDWEKRFKLIAGEITDAHYYYSMAPDGRTFIVHPGITTGTYLEVSYDGIKTTFEDVDSLGDKWTENIAEAVAEYTKERIVRHYDKDDIKRVMQHKEEYMRLRKLLFLDQKD